MNFYRDLFMKMMKAAVFVKPGKIELQKKTIPEDVL
jgi:hypothetical protein